VQVVLVWLTEEAKAVCYFRHHLLILRDERETQP